MNERRHIYQVIRSSLDIITEGDPAKLRKGQSVLLLRSCKSFIKLQGNAAVNDIGMNAFIVRERQSEGQRANPCTILHGKIDYL